MFSLQLIAIQLCCFWRHKMPRPDKFKLTFKQSCKQKMKFIFQNTHENNRLSVKNCSHVLQFKVFWDYDSTIIKRSRRSGFTTSLQKFWTVFHFFLVYSTSRLIDTFSEVTDLGSDTASQQSNFLTWSIWALIFLQRPNISRLRTLHYKFIWNFFLQSPGCCCRKQAMVCELTFNSSVFA